MNDTYGSQKKSGMYEYAPACVPPDREIDSIKTHFSDCIRELSIVVDRLHGLLCRLGHSPIENASTQGQKVEPPTPPGHLSELHSQACKLGELSIRASNLMDEVEKYL